LEVDQCFENYSCICLRSFALDSLGFGSGEALDFNTYCRLLDSKSFVKRHLQEPFLG
jgi:hypothetical protein